MCRGKFWCRAVVPPEDPPEVETFCMELTPLDRSGSRTTSEWALEHLQNWSREDWLTALAIEEDDGKIYEVVFYGQIRGWFCPGSGEWDEEVESLEIEYQRLPDDWFG